MILLLKKRNCFHLLTRVIKDYSPFDRADTPLPLPNRADSSSTPHTSEVVCRWVFSLYICLGEML